MATRALRYVRNLSVPEVGRWFALAAAPLVVLVGLLLPILASSQTSDPAAPTVVHIEISGTIDLGLAPFLERVLEEAEEDGAAAVVLEINTPGGRLDAVIQMKDALLDSPVRTIAFVNRSAFSAGALIAIASTEIYMAPGAVMGAATPVYSSGEAADEKTISAVRATFKSTAEFRGRDPIVAEAMVDPAIEIPGLVAQGELLTLTTEDAVSTGYADAVVNDLPEVLAAAGLSDALLVEKSLSLAERIVRIVTDPLVASILIAIGILLVVADLLTAGFGPAGLIGIVLLGLFFWGHVLAGLAGWEDLILILIGIALIAVEIFVIPGFGVFGLLGLASLAGGFWLAMVNSDTRLTDSATNAGWAVAGGIAIAFVGIIGFIALLPHAFPKSGFVLKGTGESGAPVQGRRPVWLKLFGGGSDLVLPAENNPVRSEQRSLTGIVGTAISDLRPSGIAMIGGKQTDVVTEGEYINAGEPVVVSSDESYRRVVRRVLDAQPEA